MSSDIPESDRIVNDDIDENSMKSDDLSTHVSDQSRYSNGGNSIEEHESLLPKTDHQKNSVARTEEDRDVCEKWGTIVLFFLIFLFLTGLLTGAYWQGFCPPLLFNITFHSNPF